MTSPKSAFDFLDEPVEPGDLGSLSHYRVVEELGRGGMGYVFRAKDKRLQRDVALKVMNQKVAGVPFSRHRFIREARAMAAVHHDNVATIFEVGEKAGTPFMAMEMLKGSTLERLNESDQRLGYEQVIRYADQIARGLAAAHAVGIVHRDIKPANLWLEPACDRIKILDFGLALAATPVDQLAGRGAVIGTPGYLSPEQARTEPLDDRSDLYSLGVVLYELCAGSLPLQSGTVSGQLIAILSHRPRPLHEVNPQIPAPLADLIHRLLYKEPRARVPSAQALVDELARVEKECHAKSDVAQAINKLQQGLSEVVSKKVTPLAVEPAASAEVLDPFESIPDAPLPASAAPATRAAPLPAATPMSAPAYLNRPASRPAAPSGSSGSWQKYLPIAAVVAVAVIALPIMTFMFSSAGGHQRTTIVGQGSTDALAQNQDSGTGGSRPDPQTRSTVADRPPKRNANQGQAGNKRQTDNQARAGNQARQGQGNRANANRSQGNGGQGNGGAQRGGNNRARANAKANNNRNNNRRNANMAPSGSTVASNAPGSEPNQPVVQPVSTTAMDIVNSSSADRVSATPSTPEEPARETILTRIGTDKGRGADTMVQIGTTNKLGKKPSIGVHRRGKIESHHSYLRFDLAEIADVTAEVESVELILTLVGRGRPEGATVRLYGMDMKGIPLWPEEGPRSPVWANTPSKDGLDSLPLLGTATITSTIDPRDDPQNVVRIGGDELAAFIRDAGEETVNLVLAGGSGGNAPLRFVSRDGADGKAPALLVRAPAEPSKKKPQFRGRQR